MKALKDTQSIFSISNITILSIAFISVSITHVHGSAFNRCFPDRYNFTCADPYDFLLSTGTDVEHNIIPLSDLQLYKEKPTGHSQGGIYRDFNQTTYYVKHANPMTEFIGSKLMNLIVGTRCTPVVKIVRGQYNTTASQSLPNFQMQKNVRKKKKKIKKAAEMAVAMDFLGIVDRNPRNMGYVSSGSKKLLAARVDFDASFGFTSDLRHGYVFNTDHLDLRQLYGSAYRYPKKEVRKAIKKIITIPDEKIIMTVFQCWVTLSRTESPIALDACFDIARKLVERKDAFRVVLADPNSIINRTKIKKSKSSKKIGNNINGL